MNTKKLLIVDDQESMRRFVETSFRSVGVVDLHFAENGADAIEVARRESPDLIVMDMSMPNGNGLTLLRKLRESTGTVTTPVIIISAGDFHQMSSPTDSVAVLRKPFTCRQLVTEAERLFACSLAPLS